MTLSMKVTALAEAAATAALVETAATVALVAGAPAAKLEMAKTVARAKTVSPGPPVAAAAVAPW